MFKTPKYGWSDMYVDDEFIGAASYIDDVPIYTMETIVAYLKGKSTHFELSYDAEGYFFGICEIMGSLYAFSDKDKMRIVCPLDPHYEDMDIMESVRKLAKAVYEDFTTDRDEWLAFFVDNSFPDFETDMESYTKQFDGLLNELKQLLDQPYHAMELGNLMFGNSRGEFCIPRDNWEDAFYQFLTQCGFDSYGNMNDALEPEYCATDYAEESIKLKEGTEYTEHVHYFKNDIFELRPYFWGDDESLKVKPNFVYKPENLEISWYKYPFRDAYSNKQLTFEYFCYILKMCAASLNIDLNV